MKLKIFCKIKMHLVVSTKFIYELNKLLHADVCFSSKIFICVINFNFSVPNPNAAVPKLVLRKKSTAWAVESSVGADVGGLVSSDSSKSGMHSLIIIS